MKRNDIYLYILVICTAVLFGCSADNDKDIISGGEQLNPEEATVIQLQIQDASLSTYASDTDIPAESNEKVIGSDLYIYIFNESGKFETFRKESLTSLGNYRWQTGEFTVENGSKYFYVFANIGDGFIPTPAPGSSNIDFEKTEISVTYNSLIGGSGGFVMGTLIGGITRIYGTGHTGNPELIELSIGRLVTKVKVESLVDNPPLTDSSIKGSFVWSSTRFGVVNHATRMFLVGQWQGGFRQQGSQVLSPHYYSYSVPADITPPDISTPPMIQPGPLGYFYTTENTNEVPRNENAASFVIKLVYETVAEELHDVNTHKNGVDPSTLSYRTFWRAEFEDGTKLLYNGNPNGKTHPDLGRVINAYQHQYGECYYRVPLADNSEEELSARYSAIRNHYYILKITSVKGIGSHAYMPIEDPEKPLENTNELDYVLTVKDWTTIDVNGEL